MALFYSILRYLWTSHRSTPVVIKSLSRSGVYRSLETGKKGRMMLSGAFWLSIFPNRCLWAIDRLGKSDDSESGVGTKALYVVMEKYNARKSIYNKAK